MTDSHERHPGHGADATMPAKASRDTASGSPAHGAPMHMPTADGGHETHAGAGRHEGHHAADFRRRFWVCLIVTIPVLAMSPGLPFVPGGRLLNPPGADRILLGLSAFLYLYGGMPFLKGIHRELRARTPGMMTLVAVAITVSFAYSAATVLGLQGNPFFWESATLIDVMLLGHWIEMRAVGEASRAVEALAALVPAQAHLVRDDSTVDVATDSLLVGDVVLVRPGEKIPADGTVTNGSSLVDESLLTGESKPVPKGSGGDVVAGALNGSGALTVEVRRVGSESFLAQVVALVAEAQSSKSHAQDLADRAAFWLTLIALGGGTMTFGAWLAGGRPLAYAIERAVTVMVIACPHALGLAVPLVIAVSTALAAREGLFVRDRLAFENARRVTVVVFDKTGTLTLGHFSVSDVNATGSMTQEQVIQLAASVEQFSEHRIARAIVEVSSGLLPASGFVALPGEGVRATVDGRNVSVVSVRHLEASGGTVPSSARDFASQGHTVAIVVVDDVPVGVIGLADAIRPSVPAALRRLRALGIEPVMLTGDSDLAARSVASRLGIERYWAGVSPVGKADVIRRLQAEGGRVAMVGDGVNDAPSLAAADVGFAIGAGTDVAVAAADIVLVRDDPADIATVIGLARVTYRKMRQNLAWATGYNAIAIPLAAGILAPIGIVLAPAVGGALMAASTVIVAVNARILRMPRS